MNARNDINKLFDQNLDARLVRAAAQLRLAAWIDVLVARWLERRAADIEAAQRLFKGGRKRRRSEVRRGSKVVCT
jgi:hypothetical protein